MDGDGNFGIRLTQAVIVIARGATLYPFDPFGSAVELPPPRQC